MLLHDETWGRWWKLLHRDNDAATDWDPRDPVFQMSDDKRLVDSMLHRAVRLLEKVLDTCVVVALLMVEQYQTLPLTLVTMEGRRKSVVFQKQWGVRGELR